MKLILRSLLILLIATPLAAFDTTAKNAYVIDVETGATLFDKDSQIAKPPASMSKLMTLALVFKALDDGKITLDTEFPVSQKAHDWGGSKMFVQSGTTVSVNDLLQGVIVQSGNDACIVLAEGLAGTEAAFAEAMNAYAAELGLEDSRFGNATGWPNPNQRMSARDLAQLAYFIETRYPQYMHYFSQNEFTYAGITQQNRNPLLGVVPGAYGFKTGHTEEAGYGLVGGVTTEGRRVVFVLMGMDSKTERADQSTSIANWALNGFKLSKHNKAGEPIIQAPTWLGEKDTVGLTTQIDFVTLQPLLNEDNTTVKAVYDAPITAPIKAGTKIGTLVVNTPELPEYEIPLYTAEDVARGGYLQRLGDISGYYFDQALASLLVGTAN